MPRTELMNRLLRLTKNIHSAEAKQVSRIEYAQEQAYHSRRTFLQTGLKAGVATALLAGCSKTVDYTNNPEPPAGTNQPTIAIIGAGIAGLNAAYTLKQSGIRSTVYEAANRTGGRMFTAQNILNHNVSTELGGEFIDSSHTEILSLAQQFSLPVLDLYAPDQLSLEQNIYFFNGISYSDENFLNDIKPYLKRIKADAVQLSNKITYKSYSNADLRFDNMSLDEYFDSIDMKGWIRECLLVAYLGEFGLNTDVCNAINFLYLFGKNAEGQTSLYGESDQRFKIKGGNQRVAEELTKRVDKQIEMEHSLIKIKENKTKGYDLYFDNNGKTITVQTDMAILTLPYTVLRNVEMHVEMDKTKKFGIHNLSYGSNSKLLIGFNGKDWKNTYNSTGMCYSDNGLQNGWDNSQEQNSPDGGYTIYLGGSAATKLGKSTASDNCDKFLPLIDQVYPGMSQSYNGKNQQFVWRDYKHSKASYSAWSVGQYTSIAGSEGEPIDNLYFAGEHTSYNFQGYMNGGAISGRITAERILKKINK